MTPLQWALLFAACNTSGASLLFMAYMNWRVLEKQRPEQPNRYGPEAVPYMAFQVVLGCQLLVAPYMRWLGWDNVVIVLATFSAVATFWAAFVQGRLRWKG